MKAEMNFDNIGSGGGGSTDFKFINNVAINNGDVFTFHTDNAYIEGHFNYWIGTVIDGVYTNQVGPDTRIIPSYDTTTKVLKLTGANGGWTFRIFYNDLG